MKTLHCNKQYTKGFSHNVGVLEIIRDLGSDSIMAVYVYLLIDLYDVTYILIGCYMRHL